MKKILIIICLIGSTVMPACNKYLDIVPDNVATIDYAFKDKVRAEQFLFTCYSYMPRYGLPNFPSMFDDFVWSHSGIDWLPRHGYIALRDGNNVSSPLLNFWNGLDGGTNLYQGIRNCNILIERAGTVRDLDEFEKKRWIAEAKFLKAFYHFFLMQLYGPIPIVDENLPIDADPSIVSVYREPIDKIVDYIVQLMDEASLELPLVIDNEVSELGRITKPIALAMKAKVLVTAASPLFNGNEDFSTLIDNRGIQLFNQTKDRNKWVVAMEACKAAIDTAHLAGIELYNLNNTSLKINDSTKNILTVNQVITDKWNRERIWGTGNGGNRTLEEYTLPALAPDHKIFVRSVMVPTLKAVEYFYSNNGVPINEDEDYDYEGRYTLTTTTQNDRYYMQPNKLTAKLHLNREPRFYGSIGVDGGWWFGLGRVNQDQQWPINAKMGEQSGRSGIERFSSTSFYMKKFSNYMSAYSTTTYVDVRWDYPIFRLSDLYLLYAEALNETLAAPNEEVFKYVDMIRERAGLKGVKLSWDEHSKFKDKYTNQEGMRNIIQTERNIELAFEGHRLWDLRRWNQAVDNFNQPVQGWNIEGEGEEDFYRVTTINLLNYSLRDVFWPIRQGELSINRNLIQNLGW